VTAGRRRAWVHWAPALVWAITLFVLSAQPRLPEPPGGITDKHSHALAYGLLAVACLHGLVQGQWRRVGARSALLAALMAAAYGVSDEWHQSFVPGRFSDLADVLADALGAAVAAGLAWAWAILLRRRASRRAPRRTDGHGASATRV
jgi:VanZ family protein